MNRTLAPKVKESLLSRWEPLYRSRLHYLVTWSTRGRRPVLRERHITAFETLIQQACDERGYSLLEVAAGSDHAHVLIGLRPAQSISSVVRELKGKSGMALLTQHPELRVWLRGNLVWDERYAVETVSPARVDKVRERLHNFHAHPNQLAEAS
ncbi:MAG: IS200/IS605 family transposase [Candidatus Eisenbacteria bacterium]|nr:IS200/IS605 family transposase [Candidatus Eisenbacteria bacterium]